MQEDYKGCIITYREYANDFEAVIGEGRYQNKELAKVREKIDKVLKPVFERVAVLAHEGYSPSSKFSVVEVTSEDGDSCWVTKSGTRSKRETKSLFINNKENQNIISTIAEMEKRIDAIKKSIVVEFARLDKYRAQGR